MHTQALQAATQALRAIDLRNAIYVACPVSSGRRELDLMARLAKFDRDELRRDHHLRWRREVLEPNVADAEDTSAQVRKRCAGQCVINPATFEIPGLGQPGYDALCEAIIRSHVTHVVLATDWQFSRGARIEAMLAMELELTVENAAGDPMGPGEIVDSVRAADRELIGKGFPRTLLPELSVEGWAYDSV